MKNEIISVGKIEDLFKLNRGPNNAYEANVILQVVAFSHNVSENRSFYSFTLSDSINKYAGFIYLKELSHTHQTFEANDLIRLKKFSISELTNKVSKVIFIVKDVDYYGKIVELIGTPEEYKEKSAAEKEMKKNQDELMSLYNNAYNNLQMNNLKSNLPGMMPNIPPTMNINGLSGFPNQGIGNGMNIGNGVNGLNNGQNNGLYLDYQHGYHVAPQVQRPENTLQKADLTYPNNNLLDQIITNKNDKSRNRNSTASTTNNSKSSRALYSHANNLKKKTNEVTALDKLTTFSKNFTILVRVLRKSDLIPFYKNDTQGMLLSFNVLDTSGLEMEIKAFNTTAERAFAQLKEHGVYKIYGLYVKLNDKKYSSIKSEFCLILEDYFTVETVEDDNSIKPFSFKFIKINKLNEILIGTTVDVLVRVTDEGGVHVLNTKNGEREIKRIKVADDSENEIELSLWGDHAHIEFGLESSQSHHNSFEENQNNVNRNLHEDDISNANNENIEKLAKDKNIIIVAFKNVYISEFNGLRNLNTTNKSVAYIDPKIKEVEHIKKFFASFSGELKNVNQLQKEEVIVDILSTFQDVVSHLQSFSNSGSFADRGKVFKVKANISEFIHSDKNFYVGCSECRRKAKDVTHQYQCTYCKKEHDKPFYIYAFLFKAKDTTGECLLDVIGEVGNNILGIKAEEYRDLFLANEELKFKELIGDLEQKEYFFYIRPRLNYFNGESRKKLSVVKVEPTGVNVNNVNTNSNNNNIENNNNENDDEFIQECSKEATIIIDNVENIDNCNTGNSATASKNVKSEENSTIKSDIDLESKENQIADNMNINEQDNEHEPEGINLDQELISKNESKCKEKIPLENI